MNEPIERRAVFVGMARVYEGRNAAMWVEIEYGSRMNPTKPPELSICGVLGPDKNGDAAGSCGQNSDDLLSVIDVNRYAKGFDAVKVHRLWEIWERWHLNGMNAGTPAQEALLREKKQFFPGYPTSYHEWAKALLAAHGLQPDGDYSYGSAWLHEDVPADVIEWLRALPEPDRVFPWSLS